MKITKKYLRKIISESIFDSITLDDVMSAVRTEMPIPTDPKSALDYLANSPDPVKEKLRDELADQIRTASKDLYSSKDMYDLENMSIDELEDLLHDLSNSPEQRDIDRQYRDKEEDELGRDHDLSQAEMAPKRQGMSRRPSGSKSQRRMESRMRMSEAKLRQLIREELQLEFFGIFKDKVPRDSSGNVSIAKLPRDQQDIYIKIKAAVQKTGESRDSSKVIDQLGVDREEHYELIQAAIDAGRIAYSHANM